MSSPSPRAAPAPTTPPAPPNATSPPPVASAPPPVATSPPPTVPSPPAPVVTPPPAVSPPPPVTPVSPPPADSPPSPPTSTPSPPPPSSSPSPPSPPSSTPSPPGRSSPPPPSSGRRSPPPPPPRAPTPATPSSNGGGGGSSNNTPMVVGIAIAAVAVLAVLSLICIFCRRKKRRDHPHHGYFGPPSGPKVDSYGGQGYQWQNNAPPPGNQWHNNGPPPGGASRPPHSPYMSSGGSNYSGSENLQNIQPPPPPPSAGMAYGFAKSQFTYDELAKATDDFSEANLLGQGGFGYVHKGILPKEGTAKGTEVAIKQLKAGSGQGEREFQAEVEIISRVHHKHLVTLVGYCITGFQRLLVYEFVPNNTLEFHLHGKGTPLGWTTRMKIALGSAKGLAYLHEDCHPKIIHRDIKAANILIDFSFEAKVADFGLAKLTSDLNTHVSTRVMGTFGYLAPEYAASGKLTEKSDVFSFGVVLLELITGRRPVDADDSLVDWAKPLIKRAEQEEDFSPLVDPRLENNFNRTELPHVCRLALNCVDHFAKRRPRMSQVVRFLEGEQDLSDGSRQHGSVYSSHGSSDYDTVQYQENIRKMRKTAFADSSEYGATSEYGLNPSGSSSEAATTREMIMGKVRKDNNSP